MESENAPTSIGERIRQARTDAGLTQRQLAEALRVHRKTVERWERDGGDPRLSSLSELAVALGVGTAWLLGEEAA